MWAFFGEGLGASPVRLIALLSDQGAIEVWEYSLRQIKAFEELEKEQHSSRVIKFRHVPFSWFPVVCSMLTPVCTKHSYLHCTAKDKLFVAQFLNASDC